MAYFLQFRSLQGNTNMMRKILVVGLALGVFSCAGPKTKEETTEVTTIASGAPTPEEAASLWPTDSLILHMAGVHPMKSNPSHQVKAHHYCNEVNDDLTQCVIYDSHSPQARMTGIQYIISNRLYAQLPLAERQYWAPKNYEILSGQLTAPGMTTQKEHDLMRSKLNSYSKTYQFNFATSSDTGMVSVPMGQPMLAWTFNRDGEVKADLQMDLETEFNYSSSDKRAERQDLVEAALPQDGVNTIAGFFPGPTREIPGVTDRAQAGRIGLSP
jgi:hypothetical protein